MKIEWLAEKRARDVPWMTDNQWDCYLLVADVFGGFHHMNDKPKPWGSGIKLSEDIHRMSTFDMDSLTNLVFYAHDQCIRVQLAASSPGMVGIILHKRHCRVGDISRRHPTLEFAVQKWREYHPEPNK